MLTLAGLFVFSFFFVLGPQVTTANPSALSVTDVPLFLWTLPNMLFPSGGKVANRIGNLPYHVPSRRSVKPNEAKKESTTAAASPTISTPSTTAASAATDGTSSVASSSEASTTEALLPEEAEKIADNTVMYLKMAVYVIKAHAMCFYKIAKLTGDHVKKYLKLLMTNPFQILILPFTFPISSVKFLLGALKLFVQIIVTLILK